MGTRSLPVKLIPTKDVKKSVNRWTNNPSKYTEFFEGVKALRLTKSVVIEIPEGKDPKKFNTVLWTALRNRNIRAPKGFRFSFRRSVQSQFSVSLVKKK